MTEIVDPRKLPGYDILLTECQAVRKGLLRRAEDLLVEGYWELGKKLVDHEQQGTIVTKYAQSTIKCLSQDMGMHHSDVYRAMQFARKCPDEQHYLALKNTLAGNNHRFNWSNIKRYVLPEPSQVPEVYGGKSTVADDVMNELESLNHKVRKLREMLDSDDLELGVKEEIVGVITDTVSAIKESVELSPPAIIAQPAQEKSTDYLSFVKTLPCIQCGEPSVDVHHVDTGGTGMKGSDYYVIPLCREHHQDYHNRGKTTFATWYGIDLYREVAKCLATFIQGGLSLDT